MRCSASCLVLLIAACGGGHPPGSIAAASPGMRVVSFNIRAGTDMQGTRNLERVGMLLDSLDADIILLQEVDYRTSRSGDVDQLAELQRRTGLHAARGVAMDFDGGEFGTALLSRFPIVSAETIPLPVVRPEELSERYYEPRALLHAIVDAPGSHLHVLGTHLDHNREGFFRGQQLFQILGYIAEAIPREADLVLGGDLNARHDAPEVRALSLYFSDAWKRCGSGSGFTFPADVPVRRIDYVLLRGLRCSEATVVPTTISDHRPVVVDIVAND